MRPTRPSGARRGQLPGDSPLHRAPLGLAGPHAGLPCSPASVEKADAGGFSAAAYYFGRMLHKELKIPIGLINSSWGGTPAEFWTSREALDANPALKAPRRRRSSTTA